MSEAYQIIKDEAALHSFIQSLPDLKEGERFYGCLFSRKKYWPEMKPDKSQLKRFVSTKERLFDKISQLESKVDSYKFDGKPIPNEALALYLMPNPRNLVRATTTAITRLVQFLADGEKNFNPNQEVLSAIQVSKSRSIYRDYDFDTDTLPDLNGILNPDSYRVLKTRGGFHVLVETDKVAPEYKKTFELALRKLGPDVVGDVLLPVPGCVAGGFSPYFIG
jgi:hypothetical protein